MTGSGLPGFTRRAAASPPSLRAVLPTPDRSRRLLAFFLWGVALVWFAYLVTQWLSFRFEDGFNYLAAGERLNAGHDLYALAPGDRPTVINPPYFSSPFMSPPFVAVLWRPLAMAGEISVIAWSLAIMTAVGATVWALGRRRPIVTAISFFLLALPLGETVTGGNVNGFVVGAMVLVWRFSHVPAVGAVVGVLVAVKVTPLLLLAFLLRVNRPAMGFAVLAGLACVSVGLVGAGPDALLQYLEVARTTVPYEDSLSGVTGISWASLAALLLLGIAALMAPSRKWGFALAVVGGVIGNPAIHAGSMTLLLPALAPLAWPSAAARANPNEVGRDPVRPSRMA